jgi:hypothetical protein
MVQTIAIWFLILCRSAFPKEEPMSCKCAEMDWSGVDQTLEHHPDCLDSPEAKADIAAQNRKVEDEYDRIIEGPMIPARVTSDRIAHLDVGTAIRALTLRDGDVLVVSNPQLADALCHTEAPVDHVVIIVASHGDISKLPREEALQALKAIAPEYFPPIFIKADSLPEGFNPQPGEIIHCEDPGKFVVLPAVSPDDYVELPEGSMLGSCPFDTQKEIEKAIADQISVDVVIACCSTPSSTMGQDHTRFNGYYALHPYCGARGPVCDSVEEAVAAWNQR